MYNPINNIWNYNYIQQQAQAAYHQKQVMQIQRSALKLHDFLQSLEDIDPAYQNDACVEFCTLLAEYMMRHRDS